MPHDPCRIETVRAECGAKAVQPTLLGSLLDDLSNITGIVATANMDLIDTRRRLFGPWPESDSASALKEAADSMEGRLADALSRLRSMVATNAENAAVLNSRV